MRKVFWCGTLLAVAVTVAVYWTGVYAGRHPETLLGQCTGIIYEGGSCTRSCTGDVPGCEDSDLCSPEEPQAVVDQLPDQPEPIDLYKSAPQSVQEPSLSVAALPPPEPSFPSAADEDDGSYKTMPLCEDEESDLLKVMPYATDEVIQALQLTFPPFKFFGFIDVADLTSRGSAVQPTGPRRGEVPGGPSERLRPAVRPTVDTTEFRPTDAKRGEFEKAPF